MSGALETRPEELSNTSFNLARVQMEFDGVIRQARAAVGIVSVLETSVFWIVVRWFITVSIVSGIYCTQMRTSLVPEMQSSHRRHNPQQLMSLKSRPVKLQCLKHRPMFQKHSPNICML